MTAAETAGPVRRRRRTLLWLAIGGGVAALVAANAHLVHVALRSQPDCVAHAKTTGEAGTFRAARPAC